MKRLTGLGQPAAWPGPHIVGGSPKGPLLARLGVTGAVQRRQQLWQQTVQRRLRHDRPAEAASSVHAGEDLAQVFPHQTAQLAGGPRVAPDWTDGISFGLPSDPAWLQLATSTLSDPVPHNLVLSHPEAFLLPVTFCFCLQNCIHPPLKTEMNEK